MYSGHRRLIKCSMLLYVSVSTENLCTVHHLSLKTHDASEDRSAFVFRRNVERKESTTTGREKGIVTMQGQWIPLTVWFIWIGSALYYFRRKTEDYGFYIAKLPILFELFEQMKHFLRIKLKFDECDKNNIILWAFSSLKWRQQVKLSVSLPWQHVGGVEVLLHSFLTSALD